MANSPEGGSRKIYLVVGGGSAVALAAAIATMGIKPRTIDILGLQPLHGGGPGGGSGGETGDGINAIHDYDLHRNIFTFGSVENLVALGLVGALVIWIATRRGGNSSTVVA